MSGNLMHVFTYLIYPNYFTVQGKYILISVAKMLYINTSYLSGINQRLALLHYGIVQTIRSKTITFVKQGT